MRETRVRSLGWEDPLEKEMVTHSSILAWKIPWTEKSGRLQSMGSQRVGHDWATSLHIWNKCKFEIYIWNSSDSTEHTHVLPVQGPKLDSWSGNCSHMRHLRAESEREVAQSCLHLYNPGDSRLPGFSVHGILQARIPEQAAISFSGGSSRPRDWTRVSHIAGGRFTV